MNYTTGDTAGMKSWLRVHFRLCFVLLFFALDTWPRRPQAR